MTRPTAVLLAAVVTAITVPATLRWGPLGAVICAGGFGFGYGVGLLVEWLADDPDDDLHHREWR